MADKSAIEWTDASWNPVTGCTKVSPGCDNCYAERLSERFRGVEGHAYEAGFDLTLRPDRLDQPLRWKKPRQIFVNSMSDLFHRDIPDEYLQRIWAVMVEADHHIYQILTKRAHRMAHKIKELSLPLPYHIWLGVSVEDQSMADSRIPALLGIGSLVPWVSAEPLLAPIDLRGYMRRAVLELGDHGLKWVVVGGESGPKARPMQAGWARTIRDQCLDANVPYFFKQWGGVTSKSGGRLLDGREWDQMPEFRAQGQLSMFG